MKRLAYAIVGVSICLAAEVCRIPFNHHPTKATIQRWKEWGASHPKWKPKETLTAFDFACNPIDLEHPVLDDQLPLEPLPDEIAAITHLEPDLTYTPPMPEVTPEGYPLLYVASLPIPAPIAATPELPTLYLLIVGILAGMMSGCNTFHLPPTPRHPAPPAITPPKQ